MKTRRTKHKPSSSNSSNGEEEKSEPIPFDLIIEILTRLPAKSIARLRCVSKLWESTLRSPNFTESFLAISSSRPKLLFTCIENGKAFFSSPQPQNSAPLAVNFQMSFQVNSLFGFSPPVGGLVCSLNRWSLEGKIVNAPLICNLSTGQSLILPIVRTRNHKVISYFGYDPINKEFKVLCMSMPFIGSMAEDHQVLTLGTEKKLSWRMIKCDILYDPCHDHNGICINGVLYYSAWLHNGDAYCDIVCFDIRSEKFNCIQKAQGMLKNFGKDIPSTLINYKGKLGMLLPNYVNKIYAGGIQLWVIEDTEKSEWSSYNYVLPLPCNIFEDNKFHFVGMTGTGEIVISPNFISSSSSLIFYNPERNTAKIVEIQGMEAFKKHKANIFLDHVEDVKLMASI